MGEAALNIRLSVADYLAMERLAEVRHEYHRGEIFAMAGWTYNHAKLGTNLIGILISLEKVCGCNTFNGIMRIRIQEEDCFLYPEASVVCGPVIRGQGDKNSIANPVLIAEVLSETTELYDRGEKFRLYRTLPSLREYVLISQNRPLVEVFFRDETGWHFEAVEGMEALVALRSLNAEMAMEDLYRNVVWEDKSSASPERSASEA